jgi:hypothetical protein
LFSLLIFESCPKRGGWVPPNVKPVCDVVVIVGAVALGLNEKSDLAPPVVVTSVVVVVAEVVVVVPSFGNDTVGGRDSDIPVPPPNVNREGVEVGTEVLMNGGGNGVFVSPNRAGVEEKVKAKGGALDKDDGGGTPKVNVAGLVVVSTGVVILGIVAVVDAVELDLAGSDSVGFEEEMEAKEKTDFS